MSDATRSVDTPEQLIAELFRRVRDLEARALTQILPGFRMGDPIYYTASDTFDKADFPGLVAVLVECQGAGGGAPSITGTTAAGEIVVTSGGSGGGYARSLVLASDLAASEAITVPTGGGSDGGDAIFDTISGEVRGVGGLVGISSGVVAFASAVASGAVSNTGSVGQFLVRGGDSWGGFATSAVRVHPGHGGESFFGTGAIAPVISGSGIGSGRDGHAYGGGASGNGRGQSQSGSTGTNSGAPGIVVATPLY